MPRGDSLRDALSDQFLKGELKDKPLATVAEYAVNESSLLHVQKFVRDSLLDFSPADFHFLISRFRWHGIATTNYDLIVEHVYDPARSPLQHLVPFLKNGQLIETEMKRHVDGVPYLKLHGSIDHYTDEEIPLILAREQYVRFLDNRTRLFQRLQDWAREFPIIFCGYSATDPHMQTLLSELFELGTKRPMYYLVDPALKSVEDRYWSSKRITPVKVTFEDFLKQLDRAVSDLARSLPKSIGGGSSSVRTFYKVANVVESDALSFFLSEDVEHIRKGMPVAGASPKEFYRGAEHGWGAIEQNLDVPRSVTDHLVSDAILADEDERPGRLDLYAVKGPAGNGKTIVLKRAAWMAAHDYDKIVLFHKTGGAIRGDAIEELYRYTQQRIFLFIDRAALYVDDIRNLIDSAKSAALQLTIIVAEREAEWNVRCEQLDRYGFRDFPVRHLSEREMRLLCEKLEQHDSLGLLKELPTIEERVQRLTGAAQRQLLVALHEATLGKAFEDIVYEEYQRIIPLEAQRLYLDVCTLNRLGIGVRAGLIARVSGIEFIDFEKRFFRPLAHIVRAYRNRYVGDIEYSARHEHVAKMVFDRVLADPESRYDQMIRIMNGMNLDYSSDRTAFGEMVRGHSISDALRSRELGRAFFEAACRVAPREAFLLQQRGIFEMEEGGDLALAQKYLGEANEVEPYNPAIQHSLAVLARKQALATTNPLLRRHFRQRAKVLIAPQMGTMAQYPHGYHTAAQITLDELRDTLEGTEEAKPDPLIDTQIVDLAKDFERYVQEGLQKFPLNQQLLTLEAEYRTIVDQRGPAEAALKKAFMANPRQDWIAIRLARTLVANGKQDEAKEVLLRCSRDNPSSKRIHFELAQFYLRYPSEENKEFIFDHLRRSFTKGDQNYEAQFWYARQAFLTGKTAEAESIFQLLRQAAMPPALRNEVRGIIVDDRGRTKVYVGEVMKVDDAYMFVRCAEFSDNVFIHRTRAPEGEWAHFRRGDRVMFTVGFNMRGPTGATVRRFD